MKKKYIDYSDDLFFIGDLAKRGELPFVKKMEAKDCRSYKSSFMGFIRALREARETDNYARDLYTLLKDVSITIIPSNAVGSEEATIEFRFRPSLRG